MLAYNKGSFLQSAPHCGITNCLKRQVSIPYCEWLLKLLLKGCASVDSVFGAGLQVPIEVAFPTLDYDKHKILTAPTAILDGESPKRRLYCHPIGICHAKLHWVS